MAYTFAGGTDVISGTKPNQGTSGHLTCMYWQKVTTGVNEAVVFWVGPSGGGLRRAFRADDDEVKAQVDYDTADTLSETTGVNMVGAWYQVIVDFDVGTGIATILVGDETNAPTERAYVTQTAGSGALRVSDDTNWFVGNNHTAAAGMIGSIEHVCYIQGRKATTQERDDHRAGTNVGVSAADVIMLPLRSDAVNVGGLGSNGTVTGAVGGQTGPTYPSGGGTGHTAAVTDLVGVTDAHTVQGWFRAVGHYRITAG